MPAADDLFRPTATPEVEPPAAEPAAPTSAAPATETDRPEPKDSKPERGRKPSGRVRHDEKMTVYVTAEELLDLEHARLTLRRSTGLAVDRGRLVREAVAIVLADLDAKGDDSLLVQRLTRG